MEQIGKLDRYIDIEVNTPTVDADDNTSIDSWATAFSVWATREQKSAGESFRADQQVATTAEVYVVRYDDRITVNHRINELGRIYHIHGIEEIGRRMYMKITAEEVV